MSFALFLFLIVGLPALAAVVARRRILRFAVALSVAFIASQLLVILVGGYTECDRGDCGPVGGVLEAASAGLVLLAVTTMTAFADELIDYSRRRAHE